MLSPYKRAVQAHFDRLAPRMHHWRRKSRYYHRELERFCRFVIPPRSSVVEIGCGTGELLAAVEPREGVGVDLSPRMIERAREQFPGLEWIVGDAETLSLDRRFDYVIMSDLLGHLEDILRAFQVVKWACRPDSRIVITYPNGLWEPWLRLAELIGQRTPLRVQNWLTPFDVENFLYLADLEVVKSGRRFLAPKNLPFVSDWVNHVVAKLPGARRLGLVEWIVARPLPAGAETARLPTCSVVIPCRNERDNIEPAVARVPQMGPHTEIIFVDGASTDGTREAIAKQIETWRETKDIKLVLQDTPRGKGEAVRMGFAAASGDVLFVLDADLTVDPEDLPKFYAAIVEGRGDLINGTRLVYPMERQAMRMLNLLGNKMFSALFTWILEQRITDTLCGTKVIRRSDYRKLEANRAFFGDFDPFGDFDLIFGATKLNMKITELPIRYRDRLYGTTKISRFRHGLLLCRMSWIAIWRLKFA